MIKHVICFKLRDGESVEEAKAVLASMQGKIPCIKEMEIGVDELHSARSYDLLLSVILEDKEALDAYQKDAYHVDVVKAYMRKVAENSVVIDYII